jgi:hypothetical protein
MSSYKTVKLRPTTYDKVARLGTLKDSFDSIIDQLATSKLKEQGGKL